MLWDITEHIKSLASPDLTGGSCARIGGLVGASNGASAKNIF